MLGAIFDKVNKVNKNVLRGSVKSVQRGSTTLSTLISNVTISEVDLNKTFVILQVAPIYQDASAGVRSMVAVLTSSTNLRIYVSATSTNHKARWEVVEFY